MEKRAENEEEKSMKNAVDLWAGSWGVFKLIVLVTLVSLVAGQVNAFEGGYALNWSYTHTKDLTSISPIDTDGDGYIDDILVGSLDDKVIGLDSMGSILGSWKAGSTVTSVSAFVYDQNKKLDDGVAGSLDDKVYAFWRPFGERDFENYAHHWNYDTEENVYAVAGIDLNEAGERREVVAGTGKLETEGGTVYAFNSSGVLIWEYGVSSSVRVFSSADLDSDGFSDHVLVGEGENADVLKPDGTLLWSYSAPAEVDALSPADFVDKDGKLNNVLVGAGDTVYALDFRGEELWEYNFSKKVVSTSHVDGDNDGVIDYYLVASESTIFALSNDATEGKVLWSYDTGGNISYHVSLDIDADGIMDDIAIISGRDAYGYRHIILYIPEIHVSKSASRLDLTVGENFTVTITLRNGGDGSAYDLRWEDTIPEGLFFIGGEKSFSKDKMIPGDERRFSYTIEARKAGAYELPALVVNFNDNYTKAYSVASDEIVINVGEAPEVPEETPPAEVPEETPPEPKPKISVTRSISQKEITISETASVNISLENTGEAPAVNISLEDTLPEGLIVLEGESAWEGSLQPGESRVIGYVIGVRGRARVYVILGLSVLYEDLAGEEYEERTSPLTLTVIKKGNVLLLLLVVSTLVFLLAVFLLRKKIVALSRG